MAEYTRRRFLNQVGAGALVPLGGWHGLPGARRRGIEAIAAKLAACTREAAFPTAVAIVRGGATWQDILGATLLLGAREVSPQPIGNRAHSIMMVESAFQLAEATTPARRPLPVLFNLDYVKRSQHSDRGWKLAAHPDRVAPSAKAAAGLFERSMCYWNERLADPSIASMYATMKPDDVFECIWPFALRDFRFIGHKPIYAASIHRSLRRVGWRHGLPMLRSLVLGLLDGHGKNSSWTATFRANGRVAADMKVDWDRGKPDPQQSMRLLEEMRSIGVCDAGPLVAERLGNGVHPSAIWDGLRLYAAEVLTHQRGIAGVHLTTSINALHFIWRTTRRERTKRMAILQAASWMPMFRDDFRSRRRIRFSGPGIDRLQVADDAPPAAEALDVAPSERGAAAGQVLHLAGRDRTAALEESMRELAFKKGAESHVYKYCAAMLEEFRHCHRELAPRILAAGVFYLPVGGQDDANWYCRARRALQS